jgi:curli biogenesis system outer membrane secretion channel CsgG
MKRLYLYVISLALGGAALAQDARAQEFPTEELATPAAPVQAMPPAAIPGVTRHEVPALMVMGFESGTVSAQVRDKRAFMSLLGSMRRGHTESYDPSQLGIGIADMLIEKLLATGQFRLIERNSAVAGTGAQFIVTGSVTRFGFEERNVGGLLATVATMGMVGYKQHKTEVALTARVINAATGEIVASMSADGASGKGGGLRVFGIGGNGAGGGDISTSNFQATAIGQATGRAVANLAKKIVEQKSSF